MARILPSTHPALCYKEIRVTPKMRILPSVALSKMLENFATAAGRCCKGAVSKSINTDDGRLYLSHLRVGRRQLLSIVLTGMELQVCPSDGGRSPVSFLGLRVGPFIVTRNIAYSFCGSFESHSKVDKISAYIGQPRAVHLRQLILVHVLQ